VSIVLGVGLDIASIERIEVMIAGARGQRFLDRVFLPREQKFCDARKDRATAYAARFAAKEAFVKALAVPKGIGWRDIEVVRGLRGAPTFKLTGRAADEVERHGAEVLLTLSHDAGVAVAVVVITGTRSRRR
jgi:holo-[acyl-carrier protein] synthase